jgi:uncharacterized protein YjbI with pentapeptide repeats
VSTFSKEVSSLRSPDSQTAGPFARGSFAALDNEMSFFQDYLSRLVVRRVAANKWHKQRFVDADFSGRSFSHLRVMKCRFVRCRFDESQFEDFRVWRSSFEDCSFRHCELRGAVLGPVDAGECNEFLRTDFSEADLRESTYTSAVLEACQFARSQLDDVDFQGSRFSACGFSGQLRRTRFADFGFGSENQPPNEMHNVDFSAASLRWAEFKRLDLSRCTLPQDEWHVVIPEVHTFLLKAVECLDRGNEAFERELRLILEMQRRDSPRTGVGVLNRQDFYEMGQEYGQRLDEIIACTV